MNPRSLLWIVLLNMSGLVVKFLNICMYGIVWRIPLPALLSGMVIAPSFLDATIYHIRSFINYLDTELAVQNHYCLVWNFM